MAAYLTPNDYAQIHHVPISGVQLFLSQAEEIISNSVFTKPRTLIFHCGTNDLDNSDENSKVCSDLLKIIDQIKAKYPECQIILSSLLPRMDNQQPRINKINQNIKEECSKKSNVHFVSHNSVFASHQHFYDSKHLNDYGIKIFAKDLKTAFYYVRNGSVKMSEEQKQKETRNQNGRNYSFDPQTSKSHSNLSTPFQSQQQQRPSLMNYVPPPNLNFTPRVNGTKPPYYIPPQGFNLPAFNPTSGFIPPPIPQPTSPSLPPQLVELIKLMSGYVS
jgi:uncharacterized protein YdhG (YjbR/CyaY superfamily)